MSKGFSSKWYPPLRGVHLAGFYCIKYLTLFFVQVNSNGVISFGIEGFRDFYARSFPFRSPPLIAPFWDDFDPYFSGAIYYRQTNDSDLLQLFYNYTLLLKNADSELNEFYPVHLFIATWDQVPPFGLHYFRYVSREVLILTVVANGSINFVIHNNNY